MTGGFSGPVSQGQRLAPTDRLFAQGGEMGRLLGAFDWSKTSVGPIDRWPQSLRTAVSICLSSRFPIVLWWGPELVLLYNDAYIPIFGKKHPRALGQRGLDPDGWGEVKEIIGPMLRGVLERGEATWEADQLLVLERNGYPEEAYFTYSYSPIHVESGEVGGVFAAVSETTERVIGERRLKTLRELGARSVTESTNADEACLISTRILNQNDADIAFALLYLADEKAGTVTLKGVTRMGAGHPAVPSEVNLREPKLDLWSIGHVLAAREPLLVRTTGDQFGILPGGRWPERSTEAVVLPLSGGAHEASLGVLVVGISPRRAYSDDYLGFLDLAAGQIAAAIAKARAIESDRRRAQALAELDRAKTLFFTNVSHELRTPLTLLLGPLEDTLSEPQQPLGKTDRERLETARRNAIRLLKLTNTLLDFSRIEAGRVQASYEAVDLSRLTCELASVFRAAVEKAGLRLGLDCPPLPEPVFVDRGMWEKIVLNLISNALKFTFEGGIDIQQRVVGSHVELSVSDTGTGIPESEMPRIFDRFHRIANARSRTHEGSGIGLALVQELVRLHGGLVRAKSVLGKGTTFTVLVPLGSAHLPAELVRTPRPPASASVNSEAYVEEALRWLPGEADETGLLAEGTPPLSAGSLPRDPKRRARILLVDDNHDMREYVGRLLRARWDIEVAPNGRAALESVRRQAPDLVLSDIMMPELDGFGLLRELRADPATRTLPVILLSARAGEESRVEGLGVGADDYLTKPFSQKELLARVDSHLRLARLRKESQAAVGESEELLRTALGAARMYAWEWDLVTGTAQVSEGAREIIGLPRSSDGAQWWAAVHPENLPALKAAMDRAIAEAGAYREHIRLRHAGTGEWVWLELQGRALRGIDGRVTKLVGVGVDITERRKAEEALRSSEQSERARTEELSTVMESVPAIVWVAKDPEGQTIIGNRASYDFLRTKAESHASPTGTKKDPLAHVRVFESGRELSPEELPLQRALREGRELRNLEEEISFSDGSRAHLFGNVGPLRNEDGTIRGAVGAFVDVTKLKAVEREIRSLNTNLEKSVEERTAALREALQELETFTYTAAHDLRAPLRTMNQYAEMLLEEYAGKPLDPTGGGVSGEDLGSGESYGSIDPGPSFLQQAFADSGDGGTGQSRQGCRRGAGVAGRPFALHGRFGHGGGPDARRHGRTHVALPSPDELPRECCEICSSRGEARNSSESGGGERTSPPLGDR